MNSLKVKKIASRTLAKNPPTIDQFIQIRPQQLFIIYALFTILELLSIF